MSAESMAQFEARRRRERAGFGPEAEAAAHEAFRRSIRAGEDLKLPTASDVRAYGANLLRNSGGRVTARKVAGGLAETAGQAVGVLRGGAHAVDGFGKSAVFVTRIANPAFDRILNPHESAVEQAGEALGEIADYAERAVHDPQKVVRDVKAKAHEARLALDPRASSEAATFAGEMRRRFGVGQNQGELLFDVGSLAIGGPLAKSFKALERVSKTIPAEHYLARGYTPETLAYLDEPYPAAGKGSHFIPQRFGLPKVFTDSDFNVLRPPGATRRQMYEEHARIDDRFYGARLPAELGQHWSAKRLGLERYGPDGVAWYGAPAPLKARVGGLGAAAGGMAHAQSEEESKW